MVSGTLQYSAEQPLKVCPNNSIFWQIWGCPFRHWKHLPQGRCVSTLTLSFSLNNLTWLPTFTTSPEHSWPGIKGSLFTIPSHQEFHSEEELTYRRILSQEKRYVSPKVTALPIGVWHFYFAKSMTYLLCIDKSTFFTWQRIDLHLKWSTK